MTWILMAALHFAPPAQHRQFPGHEETVEQARARYAQIARDIAEAAVQTKDPKATASLMLAWAIGESGLYRDADTGPCYREGAWRQRCDGGLAATIWQLHALRDGDDVLKPKDLFADRARAARIVAKRLPAAWHSCRRLAPEDRFSGFGLGYCKAGNASVRARYRLWLRVRAWQPAASSGA